MVVSSADQFKYISEGVSKTACSQLTGISMHLQSTGGVGCILSGSVIISQSTITDSTAGVSVIRPSHCQLKLNSDSVCHAAVWRSLPIVVFGRLYGPYHGSIWEHDRPLYCYILGTSG